jgi:hypothetical protein
MTISISYSLIIGLIIVLTQAARDSNPAPCSFRQRRYAAYPRGGISSRYFASMSKFTFQ